jgi:Flp pilus assembly protein TadD
VVRYYTAARSIRPETAHELAHVLDRTGRGDEALAVFADLVARRPSDARNLGCYAILLKNRGGPGAGAALERAVAAGREAVRLKPDYAMAHVNLGNALKAQGKVAEAAAEHREAVRLKPDSAMAHYNLGKALVLQGEVAEAVAEHREAVRLKPDLAEAHGNLGNALMAQGEVAEAAAEFREAVRLEPDLAGAHTNLGLALMAQGKVAEAVAEHREAVRLKPDYAEAHSNLGLALEAQGKVAEAVAEHREAVRLEPDSAVAHNNLGTALMAQGKVAEAAAEYREAGRLKPDYAMAHYNLGNALRAQGKADEVVAEYREAIRLEPDYAEAHCNLGGVLRRQGDYAGSLAMYRKGHELGTRRPGWRYPSAQWVAEAERLAALAERLPAILKGDDQPRDVAERLSLAVMCGVAKRHAAAARLWAEAFGADPARANDLKADHRYNAARDASLAGSGPSADDPPPDDDAKARLRTQARDWLRATLGLRSKQLDTDTAEARSAVRNALRHWQADRDLAGVRDPDALSRLPEAEREEWESLWADVASLLKRAEGRAP